jgi:uncharacterized repeat protein (TIGR01451 family)
MSVSVIAARRAPALLFSLVMLVLAGAAEQPALANPAISATKTDAFPNNGDGRAREGDTITYTVTITNNGTTDANDVILTDPTPGNTTLVSGSINTSPIARNDSYSATGNVSISHTGATGLLANDTDPDGDALTVTAVNTAGTQGNVSFNADGSFTFNPCRRIRGDDQFRYTISDGKATDTATGHGDGERDDLVHQQRRRAGRWTTEFAFQLARRVSGGE